MIFGMRKYWFMLSVSSGRKKDPETQDLARSVNLREVIEGRSRSDILRSRPVLHDNKRGENSIRIHGNSSIGPKPRRENSQLVDSKTPLRRLYHLLLYLFYEQGTHPRTDLNLWGRDEEWRLCHATSVVYQKAHQASSGTKGTKSGTIWGGIPTERNH